MGAMRAGRIAGGRFNLRSNRSMQLKKPMMHQLHKRPTMTLPTGMANTALRSTSDATVSTSGKNGVQGEGNYDAAREFNEAERQFVAFGKVDAAARAAASKSEAERQAMVAAEEAGRRHATS
jgi:hypothetical protein